MSDTINAVHSALKNIPSFAGLSEDSYTITRLGGLTNLVFRVEHGDEKLVVRLAGSGTESYIDREIELHNAQAAARAGVSAEILWADVSNGSMITRCIDPSVTMSPALFKQRKGSPKRAGLALRQLHGSGETFKFRFELFEMIDNYLEILSTKDTTLPDGYENIVKAAQPIKQLLSEKPLPLVPSHCDPLCENFLDTDDKMMIIDWEYSGMNDPLWDLGDLSVEAEFDKSQDMELLTAYFGQAPTDAQLGRMVIYKAMCDLLWTLWGLIQHADGNTAEDFWEYAITRFERCKTLMLDDSFESTLKAVREG